MFVDFFISRPIFSLVCAIILTLTGILAIPGLPIAQYPDLAPPQVTVTSSYVGASSDLVETAVTIPLEQELNGVEGMRYITSTSSNDGTSSITVTFDATRDAEVAAVDVQNRVARAASRLPSQVNETGIVVNKASSQLLMSMGLISEGDRYDAKFLSNYADVNIKDPLKRVPGVGEVRIFGERKFSMRLWLDPTELARRSLTAQDVIAALREQNLQVAAGQVGQPPTRDDQPYQIAVRARGRLLEPEEFNQVIVQRSENGELVRLGDVGRAELGAENYGQLFRFNGRTGVGLGIFQLPTANALQVRDRVLAEMEVLSRQFPPGLTYQPATDTTLAVRASIRGVLITMLEAIGLVILVIFLFLHGFRSVLVTALALPVSLLGTFAFVELFGFSINTLTLFGLTLATGIVVDDAIVVIENIERVMHKDKLSAFDAARASMREITGAIIATSVVLIAVFIPVAFFPGTTGEIYRQFALTIAASMALSTFCALTLTPSLSALLLKRQEGKKWLPFRKIDEFLNGLRDFYARLLGRLLRYPWAILAAFIACIAGTVLLFRAVPAGFIPDEDQGYVIVAMQGPEGTALVQTGEVLAQVESVLRQQPEVVVMFAIAGYSQLGNGSNTGQVFALLRPWSERTGEGQSVAEIVERLRGPLAAIGGARVLPFQPPAIRGVGTVGGFQFVVQDRSGTRSLDDLSDVVQDMVGKASQVSELRGVFSSFTAATPQLDVEVDREKAKALGVPIDQVFSTLQLYMGSQYVNDFNYANRTYRVYVQAESQFRDAPQDIRSFYVRTSSGEMIPLEALVTVGSTTSAQTIRHYNLFRSAEINGQGSPGVSSGDALSIMEATALRDLPEGIGTEWTGLSLEQKESGGQTLLIFALGILFVFLVLSAQYESFLLPRVIIFSVPLAVLGALGLQHARGLPNDIFCQVGLVVLIGLASKNAILIVEFAEQLRKQGKSVIDSVIEASATRLRPILMTSIAFLLGVVPLMLASGAGAAARNSLGTSVFGGMFVSTFVNLIFIPGLYVVVRRFGPSRELAPTSPPGLATAED